MKAKLTKDLANKKLHVTRDFNAPIELVWKAWTTSEILDQWWAPKPWRAITKSMEFSVGGMWLYCMTGPQGEQHWSRVDFTSINPMKSFANKTTFTDEHGTINLQAPSSNWNNEFISTTNGTSVQVTLTFERIEDLNMLVEMGFEGGFNMGLQNLEDILGSISI